MANIPDQSSAYVLSSQLPAQSIGSKLTICLRVGSRYIYDLYYDKEAISRQLYDWLLKNGYADGNLIAKWKKQGYEKACVLQDSPLFM